MSNVKISRPLKVQVDSLAGFLTLLLIGLLITGIVCDMVQDKEFIKLKKECLRLEIELNELRLKKSNDPNQVEQNNKETTG